MVNKRKEKIREEVEFCVQYVSPFRCAECDTFHYNPRDPSHISPTPLRNLEDYIIEYYVNPDTKEYTARYYDTIYDIQKRAPLFSFYRWGFTINFLLGTIDFRIDMLREERPGINIEKKDLSDITNELFSKFGFANKDDAGKYYAGFSSSEGTSMYSMVGQHDRVVYVFFCKSPCYTGLPPDDQGVYDFVIAYPQGLRSEPPLGPWDYSLDPFHTFDYGILTTGLKKANLYGRDHWWSRR